MTRSVLKRRTFIQALMATNCITAMTWPLVSYAASQNLKTEQITERISVITGAGGNVVVYKGNQGLTLIDSGDQENSAQLLSVVDELSGNTPIHTLFNTHWHEDHTGGNELIHARGAKIIAHENTKLWLGADFDVEWRQWSHKPRPEEALPDITFYDNGQMDLGGETVKYFHFNQAHTDGDIVLYFPDSNVMVTGGLLSNMRYPIADIATGGWIGDLIKANESMLEMIDDDTIIIPDRGAVMNKAGLQAQHAMLSDIFEQMKTLTRQGYSGHNMIEEKITSKYDTIWGSPEEFILETYRGMWAHTYDMGGYI